MRIPLATDPWVTSGSQCTPLGLSFFFLLFPLLPQYDVSKSLTGTLEERCVTLFKVMAKK